MSLRHLAVLLALLLAACATQTPRPAPVRSAPLPTPAPAPATPLPPPKQEQIPQELGGYYKDDGPVAEVPYDLDAVPEPAPQMEPLHRYANRPYKVFGKTYVPRKTLGDYREEGMASWYGRKFHGKRTASGEPYDVFKLTAAHPTLPIPSYARVTSLANGKSVVVRINDRGPFHKGRVIDLSYTAAYRLGYHHGGSARVRVEALLPGEQSAPLPPVTTLLREVEAAPGRPPETLTGTSDPLAELAERVSRDVAEPAPAPVETQGALRWVQLGAFGTAAAAEAFRIKTTDSLAWLGSTPVIVHSGGVWRVRVGPYANREQAQQVVDQIAERADLRPAVVQ
ncbi:septal ring lytic transglycosylase RlpA family protein [Chitinimonas sp. BJYL2]|uniref:septal ring lytic transglycosylase RlpA family protein n=1 Tax=Chitinimonas sp. BJYL2 TaxID=2976696 RepID=UPI0022B5149F|nr:septal ring lytic transglycosylase RlpA family protein [Chitinimonas sp. BJYL2]